MKWIYNELSMRKLRVCLSLLTSVFVVSALSSCSFADIVWETEFNDGDVINNGTVVTTLAADVTLNTQVIGNAPPGFGDPSHFIVLNGPQGNETGYLDLNMNTDENNRNDELRLTFNFSNAVTNLSFNVLDVDSNSWDDGVEIFFNGTSNLRDFAAYYTLPNPTSYVELDNEANMHGFEGAGSNSGANEEFGNIAVDFGNLAINSLEFRYFSTDDAPADPGAQFIGFSDFSFVRAVPEPPIWAMIGIVALGIGLTRRRKNA